MDDFCCSLISARNILHYNYQSGTIITSTICAFIHTMNTPQNKKPILTHLPFGFEKRNRFFFGICWNRRKHFETFPWTLKCIRKFAFVCSERRIHYLYSIQCIAYTLYTIVCIHYTVYITIKNSFIYCIYYFIYGMIWKWVAFK